ncbi:MAG: asparagine--tRNA ligase [Deltaproteobacteria bacterium]|nr:asparagine--tRNA ligase [Deltaproteobacteria bacterium]
MPDVAISHLHEWVGQEVTLRGWLYNRRSKGKIHFLLVRDGTGIAQGVVSKGGVPDAVFDLCDAIPQESAVVVRGVVREERRAPGGHELQLADVQVVHPAQDYPITLQSHGPDFLLSHRHLWIRSRRQHAILRVRDEIVRAIRDFFAEREFILVDAPIFTPAACEGTTTLFEVKYFDEKAFLTQSGQLYMEAAALAFGKVYCFGPTFRAERSKTRRHLTEFWMVEPEVAYAGLDDIMELAEGLVATIVQRVLRHRMRELEVLERDPKPLAQVEPPFPRLSYDEAAALLRSAGQAFEWGNDFGAPDETLISTRFEKPVLVHRFPAKCKAFYMKADPANPELALCVDMLAPEGVGEIIGGSQREDSLEVLTRRIEEQQLPREPFEWYLDLRRYGSVPHAGFGLGLERTVAWICGVEHVRETIPFPRMLYRLYP